MLLTQAGVSPAEEARRKGNLQTPELLEAKQPSADGVGDTQSPQITKDGFEAKQGEVQGQIPLCDQSQRAMQDTMQVQEHDVSEEVQARPQQQVQETSRENEQVR